MTHQLLIQLAIAYTLTGAFIFTVIITCLSLVGLKINRDQQNKLFHTLIVEVIVIGVSFFGGFINFSPTAVAKAAIDEAKVQIEQRSVNEVLEILAARARLGTDNIEKDDIEIVFNEGKLPEAIAIFSKPDASEVKRRQFAVFLAQLNRFQDAYSICKIMTNKAEIRNVGISVVDKLHPTADMQSEEWTFLCRIHDLLSIQQRDILLKKLTERNITPRGVWNSDQPLN